MDLYSILYELFRAVQVFQIVLQLAAFLLRTHRFIRVAIQSSLVIIQTFVFFAMVVKFEFYGLKGHKNLEP